MFVTQAKYDELVRQLAEKNAEATALKAQVDELSKNEGAIQILTSEKDLLAQQVNTLGSTIQTLTSEKDTLTSEKETLTQQVADLTAQNAELSKLPGAKTAISKSETENPSGEAINDLDKLNEFVKNNPGDVNACLVAINKVL